MTFVIFARAKLIRSGLFCPVSTFQFHGIDDGRDTINQNVRHRIKATIYEWRSVSVDKFQALQLKCFEERVREREKKKSDAYEN